MKKIDLRIFILSLVILLGAGCVPDSEQVSDDMAEIAKMYNTYTQAVESKDLDAFMSCFAENAIRSEPGVPAIIGKENIRTRFKEVLEAADYKITDVGEPIFEIIDSIAYSFRTVTITTFPKDGSDKMQTDLKTLSILKKQQDGSWKVYIDCVNYHPTWSMDTIPEGMREKNPYY